MTTIYDSLKWSTSPTGYWTMKYDHKRSGNDMQYQIYWKVWLYSESWYYNGLKLSIFLNGVQHDITIKGYDASGKGWSYEGTTEWFTVSNKTSGTTPFYAVLTDTSTSATKATSSTYSLAVSVMPPVLVSAPNFDDESNPTIEYSNPGGEGVSSLQACISVISDTGVVYADVAYRDLPKTGTSYTFVLTDAERTTLRNATTTSNSRTVIFYLVSMIDGQTYMDTMEKTLSIVNANPIYTDDKISYIDKNNSIVAITGNANEILQNKSTLTATIQAATGNKGATITGYTLTLNGVTKEMSAAGSVDFGTVNSNNDVELSVTAIDSRGNTTTVSKTVKMIPYSPPLVLAEIKRLNNYEDETYFTPRVTISSINGNNELTLTYKYKQIDGSFGDENPIENDTMVTLTCNKDYAYIFSITASDLLETVTREFTLSKGRFPLFIDIEKNAVGVNKFPVEGEALRVAGGVACFENGIVLISGTKRFLLTVNETGTLQIKET